MGRTAVVVVSAIIGGGLGLLIGGTINSDVGPVEARFSVRPSLYGDTVVEAPPLGSVTFDTHDGPLGAKASIERIRPDAAKRILDNPNSLQGLSGRIVKDLRVAATRLVLQTTASILFGAAIVTLAVIRRPRQMVVSLALGSVFLASTLAAGALTFRPRSIAEPQYTGLLTNAPSMVGTAESIVHRFSQYRGELVELITNVTQMYNATSTLPFYEPDPNTVRVLHVSDIHLNPAAFDVMHRLVRQFQINVIVDSGDLTDWGTAAEEQFVRQVGTFDVPYVFVRGNHDSVGTAQTVEDQPNGIVLEENMKRVAGLRIYGAGDPRFTPDRRTRKRPTEEAMKAVGLRLADQVRTFDNPPDMAVIHDPDEGRAFKGSVPLVLSGHVDHRSTWMMRGGTRMFIQGSTGGAGLRALTGEKPKPLQASVLYIDRATGRLQAWDDITLGGLGLTSAEISRHLEPNPNRGVGSNGVALPPPSPTPTTSLPPTPSPSR